MQFAGASDSANTLRMDALAFLPNLSQRRFGLIEVSGADAREWLHGQTTNDLLTADAGSTVEACFLKPTGQILAPCKIFLAEGRCWIEAPAACVQAILERVETMVIMEEVEALDRTGDFSLVSLQGPFAAEVSNLATRAAPEGCVAFEPSQGDAGGIDIWHPNSDNLLSEALSDVAVADDALMNAVRLEAGVPNWGSDIDEKTLPPELGPAFEARNVSYKKGCYVGQEVLARIKSRGHTNRTWMALDAGTEIEQGARIQTELREDAGRVTSTANSPRLGWIAGAMVRNDAFPDGPSDKPQAVTVLQSSGPLQAQALHFPLG